MTADPDGFSLVCAGSRDRRLRAVAFARYPPVALWELDARYAVSILWKEDWDGSPLTPNHYPLEGSENSWIHIVKLDPSKGSDCKVSVSPNWSAWGRSSLLPPYEALSISSPTTSPATSSGTTDISDCSRLPRRSAEEVGFEPTRPLRAYRISSAAPSSSLGDSSGRGV